LLKPLPVLETGNTSLLEAQLSPRTLLVSVLLDPICWESEELGLFGSVIEAPAPAEEIPHI
jgi:hypothetical protein